jgi:hypothetical protein
VTHSGSLACEYCSSVGTMGRNNTRHRIRSLLGRRVASISLQTSWILTFPHPIIQTVHHAEPAPAHQSTGQWYLLWGNELVTQPRRTQGKHERKSHHSFLIHAEEEIMTSTVSKQAKVSGLSHWIFHPATRNSLRSRTMSQGYP